MALDPIDQAMVEKLNTKMAPHLAELRRFQGMVNTIYEMANEAPPYANVGDAMASGATPSKARFKAYGRGDFYGKQLATVVKQLIEDNGPLTIEEIHQLMLDGGFKFDAAESKQVDNLKISLGKNVAFDRTGRDKSLYAIADPRAKKTKTGKDGPAAEPQPAPGPVQGDRPADAEIEEMLS